MRRADRWSRGPRVEVMPLIDVMFLLLVSFVYSVVAMVRADAIPVELPRIDSSAPQDLAAVLVLTVDRDGTLFAGGEQVDGDALAARVKRLRSEEPGLQVLVNADADARHGDVAAALDRLRACGQERVLLAGIAHHDGTPR
ncbi:MAG TPA: biopolymer transporter ExbD [Gaiellaceae bacterium]|nr:biopolymer transporter ExbD [Gaiellaceae bacterium]